MKCPICGVERPEEIHLDWCTYDGPEPDDDDRAEDCQACGGYHSPSEYCGGDDE